MCVCVCVVCVCRGLLCEVVRVKVVSEELMRGRTNGEEILMVRVRITCQNQPTVHILYNLPVYQCMYVSCVLCVCVGVSGVKSQTYMA